MKKRVKNLLLIGVGIILILFLYVLINLKNTTPKEDYINSIKKTIVYVIYEYSEKNQNGSYFEKKAHGSGIIFYKNNSLIRIFTNRHVIDCGYFEKNYCFQRLNENIKVRTYDGEIYNVSKIMISRHDLDVAVLEVIIPKNQYEPAKIRDSSKMPLKINEKVKAIGYPTFKDFKISEFLLTNGKITNIRKLLTKDGYSFQVIDSTAFTNKGSSGGGLFDNKGYLIGINTWIAMIEGKIVNNYAIEIDFIDDIKTYNSCLNKSYLNKNNQCLNYCKREDVLGKDGLCYSRCENFYCESEKFDVNDSRCTQGYIFSKDETCHLPCKSPSEYCEDNSVCYKNKCISCTEPNAYLYKDGTCRFYE